MKYTKELLQEIIKDGNANVLEEYKNYNQRMRIRFRCSCGVETSKRFEMLNIHRYPYCDKCSLKKKAEKCKETCMERYGVSNVFQVEDIKEKIYADWDVKYGTHPKRTVEIQDKWKQTCLELCFAKYLHKAFSLVQKNMEDIRTKM